MKVTKFVHSCLLVEIPDPVNRTVLFDPGVMSAEVLPVDAIDRLDNIVITHGHPDHFSMPLVQELVAKHPSVHVTAPKEVVKLLEDQNIKAFDQPSEGIELFESPHAEVRPYLDADPPEQIGVNFMNRLTHPGDSHKFLATQAVLALPVQAPWGSTVNALRLAIALQPRYVLPIHDWHWREEARTAMYAEFAKALAPHGITFVPLETGRPVELDV